MRIVAGEFRGRRLHSPKGRDVRPTSDRVREAVFSIIASRVPGSCVLDLFAGTGALGLEALSRGAARAVFVDHSPESVRLIESNIVICRAGGRAEMIRAAVPLAIRRLSRREEKFQLIFMDPPYGKGDLEKTIPLLGEVVTPEVLVVAEHHVGEVLPARWEEWIKIEERKYGDTVVSFFELDKS